MTEVVGSRTAMSGALLDTRSFTKPNAFSGLDADWQSFQFVFASYLGLLHETYDDLLEFAEKQRAPVELDTFSDDAKMLAKQLYHMLVMLCTRGRAATIIQSTERHNGFEAWRKLKAEYEPQLPGRWAAMLSALIAPTWTNDVMKWREEFNQWEVDLRPVRGAERHGASAGRAHRRRGEARTDGGQGGHPSVHANHR